jgi:hypothetical protein
VNVTVDPTPVTVQNNVQPADVTVENKVVIPKMKKAKVTRNNNGQITGIEEVKNE